MTIAANCHYASRRNHLQMVAARISLVLAISLLLGGNEFAAAASMPRFRVTALGTSGGSSTSGHDINAQGWVVGLVGGRGFLFDGEMHDLGEFDPGSINASGQMTGNTGNVYVFDGTLKVVATLPNNANGIGGINNRGDVAGTFTRNDGGVYAALSNINTGGFRDLGSLGGGFASAEGISDQGVVVGRAFPAGSGLQHAFLYDGTMRDLGTLGGTESAASSVNAAGLVTGTSRTATGAYRAFLYDTKMRDIGTLGGNSFAHSINNAGQITGRSFTPSGNERAFLYQARHGMLDLNSLIDPLSDWVLLASTGINDAGLITGAGIFRGEQRAYLLTPIPEPRMSGLLAALALFAAGYRGRYAIRSARRGLCTRRNVAVLK
jgi:probable HAF family extracellular repeat protein